MKGPPKPPRPQGPPRSHRPGGPGRPGAPGGQGGRPDRPHLGKDELRFYGKNACLALFRHRPKDIIRVYVHRDLSEEFADLLGFCAKARKSYHIVGDTDLGKLTDSVHHEGICVVAAAKRPLRDQDFFRELSGARSLVLYLDGVGNPHNLGAILRTAAHFGVKYVALPQESFSRISAAANRTSEGAAEFVSLVRVEDPERFLDRLLKSGFQAYTFEAKAAHGSLYEARLPERCVFVLGSEVEGISGLVRSIVDRGLRIPGTGAVESLNVSVVAALAMAEFQRQGEQRTVRIVKSPG